MDHIFLKCFFLFNVLLNFSVSDELKERLEGRGIVFKKRAKIMICKKCLAATPRPVIQDHDYCGKECPEVENSPAPTPTDVLADHDYGIASGSAAKDHDSLPTSTNKLSQLNSEISRLETENLQLKRANYTLKRKYTLLKATYADFKERVKNLHKRYELSHSLVESLSKCASEVPKELFEITCKRARGSRPKEYHPAIKKFSLTLHLCSAKAYRFTFMFIIHICMYIYKYIELDGLHTN